MTIRKGASPAAVPLPCGLILIGLMIATSGSGQAPAPAAGTGLLTTDTFYGLLRWDNKALYNNCWGSGVSKNGESASSIVSYNPASATIGWRWSWPRVAETELKAYPALFIGDKVWAPFGFDESTDPRFPFYLPRLKSLWTQGEITVSGSGGFDFAFDMVLLEAPYSAPRTARAEIMIWLKASIKCPAGKAGEYIIDGHTYDFFVNTDWNPRVPYLAFVLRGDAPPQRIPIHEFIRIGIAAGYVPADSYLAAVELGPEIWWGNGEASVRNFGLSLNDE
jgi:hypothetical protein